MNFDPKGTAPGINAGEPPAAKTLHVKCRNDSCDSIQAIEIVTEPVRPGAGASHNRLYQCVKCHHTWNMPVGGSVNF